MRPFWSIVTLVMVGVIVADLVTHQQGVLAAGKAINDILNTTFTNMLGGQNQSG